jgi:hypothetical protein
MLTSTPRKLVTAALAALTLSVGFAGTASAHSHHGHGHWNNHYWGGFFPIVIGSASYRDCYYVRERFIGHDGRVHVRRVKVCD